MIDWPRTIIGGKDGVVEAQNPGTPGRIGLLGFGAHAREIASYLPPGTSYFHAVSAEHRPQTDLPWVDLDDPSADDAATPVVGAVGAPGLRRALVAAWPGSAFAVVQANDAHVGVGSVLADGVVVAPHAVLSIGVRVGAHSHINIAATLSHDVHCGDFVTISPGVHVAGRVTIGDGVFLGIGACVVNDVRLAPGVVVGAGAVVLKDVDEPNTVVAGAPARAIGTNDRWLDAL